MSFSGIKNWVKGVVISVLVVAGIAMFVLLLYSKEIRNKIINIVKCRYFKNSINQDQENNGLGTNDPRKNQ